MIKYALAIVTLCSLSFLKAEDAEAQKPNVLFIAVDDLNDWVGYLGGHEQSQTPNIDKLAREGFAFQNAYCAAPVCGPSRTALMYGIYPHKSGSYGHSAVYEAGKILPKERLPLNAVFQANGYYTAGCGKIFHYKEDRGWDEYRKLFPGIKPEKMIKRGALDYGIQETDNDSDTTDGQLTDWAIDQLGKKHDKPFFIAFGLYKPHLPWVAPRKYFEQFDLDKVKVPEVPADDLDDLSDAGRLFAHNMVGFRKFDDHAAITKEPGAWQELVWAYLATSSFADANVGRVLSALEKSPHKDNTIVVLWGDHGWHLGEKEHWRKMTIWERGTHTPFIIKMPGAKARNVEESVSLQDIFPTLVELCGLEVEQELDGNSLKPLLSEEPAKWNKPAIMSHGPGNFAVRLGDWRLIRYADGSEELYNMKEDNAEWKNLAGKEEYAVQLEELRAHLPKTWKYVMGPRFKGFPDSFARPPETGSAE